MCIRDRYIIELVGADLVSITTPLTLHTENILLENDFSKQKKLPTKKVNKIVEIDDNGNIIIPKWGEKVFFINILIYSIFSLVPTCFTE